jgi:nitroreductase
MNDRLSFIFKRRSVRKFTNEAVTESQLEDLLEAAMSAPSAVSKDPWRFIILRDKQNLKAVSEFLPNGKFLADAPLGIIICGDIKMAHDNSLSYMLQDCAACIENLLLATSALGLGACWLGVHPRTDRIENISKYCELPSNVIPLSVIAIGHPESVPTPRTRFNKDYVKREIWS